MSALLVCVCACVCARGPRLRRSTPTFPHTSSANWAGELMKGSSAKFSSTGKASVEDALKDQVRTLVRKSSCVCVCTRARTHTHTHTFAESRPVRACTHTHTCRQ
eukprot:Tamp_27271.p3 GENE.Tamp_27271~~Tamp_27271.p3  ORF type:complete len:105 (+),score=7.14 Tamp_27271:386-700(+)